MSNSPNDPNIPDNGNADDAEVVATLLADDVIEDGADADSFLASLLADATGSPLPTPEEVEAQAARVEAAKSYAVETNLIQLEADIAVVKASINKLLTDVTAHLNAEFNKCIVQDDEVGRDFLVSTEGPRWYQLAVQDLQTGFMKLDRALKHPEGL